MKRKSLSLGLLALFLVLSLAAMGVGYALWSETLTINGTVNTGEVDVIFSPVSTDDPPGAKDPPGYEKDVAVCEAGLSEDEKSMTVDIDTGYPSYECTVTYDITNTGTIPVKIQSVTVSVPDELTYVETGCAVGDQIDPGQSTPPCTLKIHVEQEAGENSAYTFTKTYLLVQWNEYQAP